MIDLKACPLWLYRLLPFLRWWPEVTRDTLKADTISAFTGALIVLPQAVAFATIAGLPLQYGLYAAMIPVVVAALWGSSKHLVSGPLSHNRKLAGPAASTLRYFYDQAQHRKMIRSYIDGQSWTEGQNYLLNATLN